MCVYLIFSCISSYYQVVATTAQAHMQFYIIYVIINNVWTYFHNLHNCSLLVYFSQLLCYVLLKFLYRGEMHTPTGKLHFSRFTRKKLLILRLNQTLLIIRFNTIHFSSKQQHRGSAYTIILD